MALRGNDLELHRVAPRILRPTGDLCFHLLMARVAFLVNAGAFRCGVMAAAFAGLPVAAAADVVTEWNETLCRAIQEEGDREGRANPGWATRAMAMMNGAIYDCFQAVDRTHVPFHAIVHAGRETSRQGAAGQAAHDVLTVLYPGQVDRFAALFSEQMDAIPDGPGKAGGIALGAAIAQEYLAWRQDDGADGSAPYEVSNAPGRWQPDPLHEDQKAWGPGWGTVRCFTLTDPRKFQPPPPPPLTSEEYADAYLEVVEIGAKSSTSRTAEQTEIGFFWAYDREFMGPPPVLFNRNLREIAAQFGSSEEQNARLFAAASVAMADAAVCAWDCKFIDDFWRPINAIRRADEDGNPATSAVPDWEPLGAPGHGGDNFTPPFPAYVSGHATMGEALFRVLANFHGSDAAEFSLTSEELPGVVRSYSSFSQASEENAVSRIYLGIHWRFDATEGIDLGARVADHVTEGHFLPVLDPLRISIGPSGATLTWDGAGILQRNASLDEAGWEDLPEATSPHSVSLEGGSRSFFRLRR